MAQSTWVWAMRNGPYELVIAPQGYPGFRYRGRYAYEHTVVWWKNHGVVPSKGHQIHHLNGNHRDNRIENLQLLTSAEHARIHAAKKRKPKILFHCPICGEPKILSRRHYLHRKRLNKGSLVYCSRSCGAIGGGKTKSITLDRIDASIPQKSQ